MNKKDRKEEQDELKEAVKAMKKMAKEEGIPEDEYVIVELTCETGHTYCSFNFVPFCCWRCGADYVDSEKYKDNSLVMFGEESSSL